MSKFEKLVLVGVILLTSYLVFQSVNILAHKRAVFYSQPERCYADPVIFEQYQGVYRASVIYPYRYEIAGLPTCDPTLVRAALNAK